MEIISIVLDIVIGITLGMIMMTIVRLYIQWWKWLVK